ncbi:MAG: hypothetical protein WD267_03025 [Balneolales bacterium]
MHFSILCSMLILGIPLPSYSNGKESDNLLNTHISVGLGYSIFGPVGQIGIIYRPKIYSLNFRASSSISPDDGFIGSSISDLSVIYNRRNNFNSFIIEYGAGLAGVFVSARPDTYSGGIALKTQTEPGPEQGQPVMSAFSLNFQPQSNETRFTIGLPIEIQLIWKLNRRFALGFHTFANINAIKSNAGVFSTIQLRLPRQ